LDGWVKPSHDEDEMRYATAIEKAGDNYSAYVPDLPGCIATAPTVKDIEDEIHSAIRLHIDGLREDSEPVPPPPVVAA
jgi:predicted RNase H-like HicB family nuclease